jgi:hypothetical protein
MWMMIERDGALRQVLWNGRAENLGLVSLGVEVRYTTGEEGDPSAAKNVVLTWCGEEIPHMEQIESQMSGLEDKWMQLWDNGFDGTGRNKSDLLDAVQQLFPDEKPLLYGTGACSALSGADRAKVMQFLSSKSASAQPETKPETNPTST